MIIERKVLAWRIAPSDDSARKAERSFDCGWTDVSDWLSRK